MKSLIPVFIFLFCSLSFIGQSTFEIIINNEKNEYLICGKKDFDGNYVLTGTSQVPVSKSRGYQSSALIMKVDTRGQHVTSILHYPDTSCGLFTIIITADSNYLFTGYIEPTEVDSSQLWLYKTDKYLNKIWEKRFRIPLDEGYTKCWFTSYGIEDDDGNIVLSGYASHNQTNHRDMVLVKINQQGDILISKQFHYRFSQTINDLIKIPNSSDIILITNHISIMGYPVRLIRLDSNLNTISILPISSSDYKYRGIGTTSHWISDTSFIYCGDVSGIGNPNDSDDIGVCILDTAYNVLNEILIGKPDTIDYPAYTNCIAYYNDTTIYVAGFVNHLSFWPDNPNEIPIYRIDTALNVLSSATYGGNAYNRIYGIIAANDGGCLLYGSNYGDDNFHEEDIYILKVSPNDFLVSKHDNVSSELIYEVIVYPNPVTEHVIFKLPINCASKDYEVIIYNTFGQTVEKRQNNALSSDLHISCSSYNSGIYYYSVFSNGRRISTGKFVKK